MGLGRLLLFALLLDVGRDCKISGSWLLVVGPEAAPDVRFGHSGQLGNLPESSVMIGFPGSFLCYAPLFMYGLFASCSVCVFAHVANVLPYSHIVNGNILRFG